MRTVPPALPTTTWRDDALDDDPVLEDRTIEWGRIIPYLLLHAGALLALLTVWNLTALVAVVLSFSLRMFGITAFYHRLFSHRAWACPRWVAFAGACLAGAAAQRGPLWWAAHHRIHHKTSDTEADPHSPVNDSFLWSHTAWFLSRGNHPTRIDQIRDWHQYPELRFLDRFDYIMPLVWALGCVGLGWLLERVAPGLGTNAAHLLVWGFVVPTVLLWHATFTINSLAHRWGSRAYQTRDDSRNNFWLALLTLGEGWHNNHHRFPSSVRQGFRWWQIDPTWWVLRLMSAFGLASDLRPVPEKVIAEGYGEGPRESQD